MAIIRTVFYYLSAHFIHIYVMNKINYEEKNLYIFVHITKTVLNLKIERDETENIY